MLLVTCHRTPANTLDFKREETVFRGLGPAYVHIGTEVISVLLGKHVVFAPALSPLPSTLLA